MTPDEEDRLREVESEVFHLWMALYLYAVLKVVAGLLDWWRG